MSEEADFKIDLITEGFAEEGSPPTTRENNLRRTFGYKELLIHPSEEIGRGSYGSVIKAKLDNLPCAAKLLHHTFFTSHDPHMVDFIRRFKQECRILRQLRHPCIVQFLGVLEDPRPRSNRRPILLMELMEQSLTQFLESRQRDLSYHFQVSIVYDITLALDYLHSNGIQHRDLSSNNILLSAGPRAKLTDFGMSKMVNLNPRMSRNKQTECPGTLAYMPPEVFVKAPSYSDKIDVFSTGVLIVQIITRKFPTPTDAHRRVQDSKYKAEILVPVPELERRENDLRGVFMTHPLRAMALECLKEDDKERPTAAYLCRRLGHVEREFQSRVQLKDREVAEAQQKLRQKENELESTKREKEEIEKLNKKLQEEQLRSSETTVADLLQQRDTKAQVIEQAGQPHLHDGKRMQFSVHVFFIALPVIFCFISLSLKLASTQQQLIMTETELVQARDQVQEQLRQTVNSETELVQARDQVQEQLRQTEEQLRSCKTTVADLTPQLRTADGWTALHMAAQEGKVDVVRLLLAEAQALVNIQTEDGRTPLHIASWKGHGAVVKLLLEQHADVNICRRDGASPLFIASREGHCDIVDILLSNGANINKSLVSGSTPLRVASRNGHKDVVTTLLRNGADGNLRFKGSRPIDIARSQGHTDIVNLLQQKE